MTVKGKIIDDQTRCVHYHSELDIIAIKFRCCLDYYPCHSCHAETAGHPAVPWGKEERNEKAILCGACKSELTIREYLESGNKCPVCSQLFNPNCSLHYPLYFEM